MQEIAYLEPNNNFRFLKALSLVAQLGLSMAIPIILCLFIGKWLESLINTSPILMIIFILIGVASAFRNLYILINRVIK